MKDIPVIALTAHSPRGNEEKFLDVDCTVYISKPLDVHSFKETVAG
ncbi:MAG: hypothetical protein U9N13_02515 [Euryarchaeota archaeon]|nr:hypothetical protein [Euryarchaeota archaeon]